MKKVITYGTFDLLHYGHQRLLERAKQLGDYLVVGITSDDYDKTRGKINVQQSLSERIAAVRKTGLADKIIVGVLYLSFITLYAEKPSILGIIISIIIISASFALSIASIPFSASRTS